MALGRVTNSLFSGVVDTNLSLATLNADFSLVRVTVPKEYDVVGQCLSRKRRDDAEEGPFHQATRRLGALFGDLAPSTPYLIRAYGSRISEVISHPGVSPAGTTADGPFRDFVGADATSIWAAATSGIASLAVLLLACLLARKFNDSKISVALWVELVAKRKQEIQSANNNDELVTEASMVAARQQISCEDLARFDASVRSWLSSADSATISQEKRLMLIVKNIPSQLNEGSSTYAKVINMWRSAMTGLECLLKGMPQEVRDGSILLALSAWHLYPDLIVLSTETKKVEFADGLFPPEAVLTVGLQNNDAVDGEEGGFKWSLALSHLRYYGDPVNVEVQGTNTRLTVRQLHLAILGVLLWYWESIMI